jgi:hypothetical protein
MQIRTLTFIQIFLKEVSYMDRHRLTNGHGSLREGKAKEGTLDINRNIISSPKLKAKKAREGRDW